MIYNIYNEFIEVSVSDAGAELMSVKSRKDGTDICGKAIPNSGEDARTISFQYAEG